ncbi:MAG TPA: protein kinase [Ktedonosporobacter sp.]|nr:protein kinase [Ktedonosporobacter sp.]
MVDRVGQQFGNYQLTRLLGKGGFAEVYLGEHLYLKSKAAIKVLLTQLGKDDTASFRAEARTLAALHHPHIVRILDFGMQEDVPFLVMEYAPNGTLRQRYPRGIPLSPSLVVPYVKQLASALQYAHDQKLIHRDVKPENMLLQANNDVLLSDFGVALIAQSTHMTGSQGVIGTATYMAPEQIRGQARPSSDQYALGVVVYEWLSGGYLFQGSFTEVCAQHMYASPEPLRVRQPDLSPEIEQVVMTALAKEPMWRFGSVQAFATAFVQACGVDPVTSANPASWPGGQMAFPPISSGRIQSVGVADQHRTVPHITGSDGMQPPNILNTAPPQPISQPGLASVLQGPSSQPGIPPAMPRPESQPGILPISQGPLLQSDMSPATQVASTPPSLMPAAQAVAQGRLIKPQTPSVLTGFLASPLWQTAQSRLPQRLRSPWVLLTLFVVLVVLFLTAGGGLVYSVMAHQAGQVQTTITATPQGPNQTTVIAENSTTPVGQPIATSQPTATPRPQPTATAVQSLHPQPTATPIAVPPTATPVPPTPTPVTFPTSPQQVYTFATSGTPALNDGLASQNGNSWYETTFAGGGSCGFSGGAYHATMPQSGFVSVCPAQATNFSNFAYQVKMTVVSGAQADGGGLLFRSNGNVWYRLRVGVNGSYDLVNQTVPLIPNASSGAINTGVNQTNVITIVAHNQSIYVYINGQYIATVNDSTSLSGQIGVFAVGWTTSTDVAFSNAKVWRL